MNNKSNAVSTELESNKYVVDDSSYVKLLEFNPNKIKYEYNNNNDGFIVFSEIFYPYGWNSYINGVKTNHFKVNYILRGMNVKSGNNIIEFVIGIYCFETLSAAAKRYCAVNARPKPRIKFAKQ